MNQWLQPWRELLLLEWLRSEDGHLSYSKMFSTGVLLWCLCCIKPELSWPFVAVLMLLLAFALGPKVFTAIAQRITFGYSRTETKAESTVPANLGVVSRTEVVEERSPSVATASPATDNNPTGGVG